MSLLRAAMMLVTELLLESHARYIRGKSENQFTLVTSALLTPTHSITTPPPNPLPPVPPNTAQSLEEPNKLLVVPEIALWSIRSNMMTKTQDQVTMRARTKIQARGELKVEYRSSVKVFFRADAEPASAVLLSMTMVVVVDVRAEE